MAAEMKDVTPTKERVRVLNATDETSRKNPIAMRSQPKNVLAIIADAAANPAINPATMRELLDMQKEIVAEQARLAYTEAKLALKRKLPVINKDGRIEFKDKGAGKATLRFASFENINEIIGPLLDEFGFDLWFSSEPGLAGMINVIGHLDHKRGHTRETTFPMPHDASGGKSGAQGWASAFSFGKRITTIGLLNIQTRAMEDRDRDGSEKNLKRAKGGGLAEVPDEVPTITAAQKETLLEKINWCGVSLAKFHEHYGIEKTADLPANLFDAAVKACEDFHANKQAKERHG